MKTIVTTVNTKFENSIYHLMFKKFVLDEAVHMKHVKHSSQVWDKIHESIQAQLVSNVDDGIIEKLFEISQYESKV